MSPSTPSPPTHGGEGHPGRRAGLDKFGVTSGEIANADFMGEPFARSPLIVRYVARAMVEGSPAASALFENGASVSEEFLSRLWPGRFPPGSDKVGDAAR
jgi:hypothetical protein